MLCNMSYLLCNSDLSLWLVHLLHCALKMPPSPTANIFVHMYNVQMLNTLIEEQFFTISVPTIGKFFLLFVFLLYRIFSYYFIFKIQRRTGMAGTSTWNPAPPDCAAGGIHGGSMSISGSRPGGSLQGRLLPSWQQPLESRAEDYLLLTWLAAGSRR